MQTTKNKPEVEVLNFLPPKRRDEIAPRPINPESMPKRKRRAGVDELR